MEGIRLSFSDVDIFHLLYHKFHGNYNRRLPAREADLTDVHRRFDHVRTQLASQFYFLLQVVKIVQDDNYPHFQEIIW